MLQKNVINVVAMAENTMTKFWINVCMCHRKWLSWQFISCISSGIEQGSFLYICVTPKNESNGLMSGKCDAQVCKLLREMTLPLNFCQNQALKLQM